MVLGVFLVTPHEVGRQLFVKVAEENVKTWNIGDEKNKFVIEHQC